MIKTMLQRLRGNAVGFWEVYRWWVVLFVLAVVADGISTILFMVCDATAEEMHPAILLASQWFGPIIGPLLGAVLKAGCGILLAIYLRSAWRLIPLLIFLVGTVLSFFAAWYNLWGYAFYTPRFLNYIWW